MGPLLLTTGGMEMSRFLVMFMVLAALLTSACAKGQPQQSAYFNRESVIQQHADYTKLEEGRQQYAQLVDRQKVYQERFRVQLECLQDLQQLGALSRADYVEADLQTRMAEYIAREDYALTEEYRLLDRRVEEQYAPSRAALEAQAKNELFNLRLKLQVMKLKPEKRAQLEQEYLATRGAREQDLETWKQDRQNYYQQELAEYHVAREARIAAQEKQLRNQLEEQPLRARSFADQLATAPAYIKKIFIALDDELLQQQQANIQLETKIKQDVDLAAKQVMQARGYTTLLDTPSEQEGAVDLTGAILEQVQKNKNK